MGIRISRTLTDRPIKDTDVVRYLNRELVPVVREMLRALTLGTTPFSWSSGAATLDLTTGRDFVASTTLTQDATLTLQDGYEGASGSVAVQQDGTGGWEMTVVADGWTILREDPFTDDNPAPGAGELTLYRYTFMTVNGVQYVVFERMFTA